MTEKGKDNDITISVEESEPGSWVDRDALTEITLAVLRRFESCDAQVSMSVVGDETMLELNKRYLGKNTKTDVISFDLSDEDDKVFDIVINADLAVRQANKRGHTPGAELALYAVHGLLHNFGYDDADAEQACRMHALEDEILRGAGYGEVYNNDNSNERL